MNDDEISDFRRDLKSVETPNDNEQSMPPHASVFFRSCDDQRPNELVQAMAASNLLSQGLARDQLQQMAEGLSPNYSSEQIRQMVEGLSLNYSSEQIRQLKKGLSLNFPSEQIRQMAEGLSLNFPSEQIRQMVEGLSLNYPSEQIRQMVEGASSSTSVFVRIAESLQLPQESAFEQIFGQHAAFRKAIERYQIPAGTIASSLERLLSPRTERDNALRAMTAMIDLRGIGQTARSAITYAEAASNAMRPDLGDWRVDVKLDAARILDAGTRTEFYISRGFNAGLTDFSPTEFGAELHEAGLLDDPSLVEESPLEASFIRTNKAHGLLMRFEHRIRLFISAALSTHSGPDWMKLHVPAEMLREWEKKADKARSTGVASVSLIDYADFTDYLIIITRKSNWNEVFGEFFGHKPSIEEGFRRLYPVRLATMHARPISQDDALYLLAETRRMFNVIKRC